MLPTKEEIVRHLGVIMWTDANLVQYIQEIAEEAFESGKAQGWLIGYGEGYETRAVEEDAGEASKFFTEGDGSDPDPEC